MTEVHNYYQIFLYLRYFLTYFKPSKHEQLIYLESILIQISYRAVKLIVLFKEVKNIFLNTLSRNTFPNEVRFEIPIIQVVSVRSVTTPAPYPRDNWPPEYLYRE